MIRRATAADAPDVLSFLQAFREEALPTVFWHPSAPSLREEEAFIEKLSGKTGVMIIAITGSVVVGCLTAEVHAHDQLCHSCEFGVGVLKGHRSSGLGSALIAGCMEWAGALGLRRVELGVLSSNVDAIRLYEHLGFTREGSKRNAVRIGNRYEDLVLMARAIR